MQVRILVLHSRYRYPGGEDTVAKLEATLLRHHGHDVRTMETANAVITVDGLVAQARLFARTIWSWSSYVAVRGEIRSFRPDLLHIHNFLPLISPSAYYAAWREGVPVVQTLHNYRLVCPAATLYRQGRVCQDCLGRSSWRGTLHACYRGSPLASLAVTSMLQVHRAAGTWRRVEAYIAVSECVRRTVVAGGLPAERVYVKPNFVVDDVAVRDTPGEYGLYVGRLSPEKGVRTLLSAWAGAEGRPPLRFPLKFVGTGPLEAELRQLAASLQASVEFLGQRPRHEVAQLLTGARFAVFPSEWYEPLPVSVIEALAAGVPVLVSRMGGLVELVDHGVNGLHFRPGDSADLATAALRLIEGTPDNVRMGQAARATYLARYTPEQNYQQLLQIYGKARESRGAAS